MPPIVAPAGTAFVSFYCILFSKMYKVTHRENNVSLYGGGHHVVADYI